MKYRNCLVVIFLLFVSPGFCEAKIVAVFELSFDSLNRLLLSDQSVVRVSQCIELAEAVRDTMPSEAFRLLQHAQEIAIKERNMQAKAVVKLALADYYASRSRYMPAQDNYVKARKMFCFIRDTAGAITAYLKLGNLNTLLDNPENSRACYVKGMALAVKSGNQALMAALLFEDAKVLVYLNQHGMAGEQYRKGLVMARRAGDRAMYERILCHMGGIYLDRGQYREAIHYYKDLANQIDMNGELAGMLYTRISHAYASLGMHRISLDYNRKALDSRKKQKDLTGIVSSEINIGGDFYNLQQPDSAKLHLEKGRMLAKRCNYLNFFANALRHDYQDYQQTGDFRKATDSYKLYCRQLQEQDLLRRRSHIELHDALQKIDSANEATKALIEDARIVMLSNTNRTYQEYTVKGFIALVAIILLQTTGRYNASTCGCQKKRKSVFRQKQRLV
jgi:tetratricopeptide (TPR) repeat protein